MNYWFLYNLSDGSIYGSPYKGGATEWTNIPNNCGVVGFIENKVTDTVKDAFTISAKYKIIDNELIVNSDYVEPTVPKQQLSETEKLKQQLLETQATLADLQEQILLQNGGK